MNNELNWDTQECYNWLMNDSEILYKLAITAASVRELKALVKEFKTKEWGIHLGRVNYRELFKWVKNDK